MNKKTEARLINEWRTQGTSYRKLAAKFGYNPTAVWRMLKREKQKQKEEQMLTSQAKQQEAMPDDVEALKKALREERLKNELLNTVIDIASKELGVDIRKKSGTRRSK